MKYDEDGLSIQRDLDKTDAKIITTNLLDLVADGLEAIMNISDFGYCIKTGKSEMANKKLDASIDGVLKTIKQEKKLSTTVNNKIKYSKYCCPCCDELMEIYISKKGHKKIRCNNCGFKERL